MSEHNSASGTIPVARSPIAPAAPHLRHGWEVTARVGDAGLTLRDETPLAKIGVRAPSDGAARAALGTGFGRTVRSEDSAADATGGLLTVGSGPGEWLVLGAPGTGKALRERLEQTLAGSGEFVSVVDLTHGRALVRIRGGAARRLLAKLCGIDLDDSVTPDGAALRTSVARVVTDVIRDDSGGSPSYLLHCERSSGQHLFDALLDAGAEFGVEITGFDAGPATVDGAGA